MADLNPHTTFPVDKMAYLALLVDNSEDAIIGTNIDYIIKSWNKAATRIFGYTEAEALGKPVRLIIPAARTHEEEMILAKIKAGKRIEHYITKRVAKSGEEIDVSITVSPICNHKGEIIGASKILRDISDQVRSNKELRNYARELRKLNHYKDNLLKLASHELNTPLTTLKVYLELSGQANSDSNTSYIDHALYQCRKLEKLVQELLDYSKFEDTNLQLSKENVDLSKLLQAVFVKFRGAAKEHKMIFEGSDQEIIVQADKTKLEQVVTHLISNAIKFSAKSSPIIVSLGKNAQWAMISVQDSGIGIKEDHLPHVFERFYKVAYTESSFPGLGLSLNKSKEIINAHGGDILVDSTFNKGSTFKVLLPLQ